MIRAEREGYDLHWPGSDNEDNDEINQQILPQESHPAPVPIQTPQQVYQPPVQQTPPQTHESSVIMGTNGTGNGNTSYHTTNSHTAYQNSSPNSSPQELTPQLHKRSQMNRTNSLSDYNLYNGMYCLLTIVLLIIQQKNN